MGKKKLIQIEVVVVKIYRYQKTALTMVFCGDPFACVIHSPVEYVNVFAKRAATPSEPPPTPI
jgi:hypothetical protein